MREGSSDIYVMSTISILLKKQRLFLLVNIIPVYCSYKDDIAGYRSDLGLGKFSALPCTRKFQVSAS